MTATFAIQDVRVEMVGNRIFLKSSFSHGKGPADAKAVGGGEWKDELKMWSFPLDIGVCRRMRRVYGERLEIGPALALWARQAVQREAALPALAAADDAPVSPVLAEIAPRLAEALRPYQRVGAAFVDEAARDNEGALLADEPRTGKTLQAIAGIIQRGEKAHGLHLVAVPRLSVRNVWEREILRWTEPETVAVFACTGGKAQREKTIAAALASTTPIRFVIVNPDMCRMRVLCLDPFCDGPGTRTHDRSHKTRAEYDYPVLFQQTWASQVLDESHKVLGSLRTNKGSQAGVGLKNLPLADHGTRLAVTGTPFGKGGRVQGMFGTLHWLRPKVYTSFWRWAEEHLEVTDGEYAKEVGGLKRGTDENEFFRALGTVVLRRTRAEVMPWLAGKVYEDVYCEMTPKQRTQYKEMERNASVDGLVAAGVLAEMTRLKQFANTRHDIKGGKGTPTADGGKIAALLERLEEHGIDAEWDGTGEKAIIFTQFEEFARLVLVPTLDAALGEHRVATITGKVSDKRREQYRDAFQQDGGPAVIVMTTQTGGVSITLDRASSVHMMDELWNPEDNTQAEDRAITTVETGDPSSIAIYYYRSEGTIEEYVRDTNIGKAAEQHTVLDGRRGLEYARTLRSPRAKGGA